MTEYIPLQATETAKHIEHTAVCGKYFSGIALDMGEYPYLLIPESGYTLSQGKKYQLFAREVEDIQEEYSLCAKVYQV